MGAVTIRFENVGRAKKTWEATIAKHDDGMLDGDEMVESIHAHGGLMSRDIEVYVTSEEPLSGGIAAGFHSVGRWRLVESLPSGGAR